MNNNQTFYAKYHFGSPLKSGVNRFYFADNLIALQQLCEDSSIKGNVKLIYIDPPYSTGQSFIGCNYENAYEDRFETDDKFLNFLEKRLVLLHELLSFDGSIYLHIDTKIGHYVKVLMDKIFGKENFRNEITRIKCNPKNFYRKAYGNIKDVIYFYSKTKPNGDNPMVWNDYRRPLTESEIREQFPKADKNGRHYATTPLHAKGETINGPTGQNWKGLKPPKGRHWRYPPKELDRLNKKGLIEWSSTGNPRKIIYADENPGKKIQDIWEFKDKGFENSIYPTEKNQEMLDQIIQQSSNEGDIVLDCFAGCGTTLVSAEKYGRKWIGMDSSKVALFATLKNLFTNKVKSSFPIYYPKDYEDHSNLKVIFECIEKTEPPGDLFKKPQNLLEVLFREIKNSKKYRLNNIGLVLSGYKKGNTYIVHNLKIKQEDKKFKVSINKSRHRKDHCMIVFDIHGNECVSNI